MVSKCANPACSATFRYTAVIPIDRVTAITRLDVMGHRTATPDRAECIQVAEAWGAFGTEDRPLGGFPEVIYDSD